MTYNLKKYLKFITRKIHRNIQIMNLPKGKFGFGGTSSPRLHLFKFKPRKIRKLLPLKTKTSFKSL
jgi:hypothetical protein